MLHQAVSNDEPEGLDRMRPYNVRLGGRRTSIRLESREWEVLCAVSAVEGMTVHQFCTRAVEQRREHSQTARIRVALLDWCYREYLRLAPKRPGRRRVGE